MESVMHSAGMGRPPGPEPTIQLAFRIPKSLAEAIEELRDQLAPGFKLTRTQVVERLIKKGLAAERAALARKK